MQCQGLRVYFGSRNTLHLNVRCTTLQVLALLGALYGLVVRRTPVTADNFDWSIAKFVPECFQNQTERSQAFVDPFCWVRCGWTPATCSLKKFNDKKVICNFQDSPLLARRYCWIVSVLDTRRKIRAAPVRCGRASSLR